MVDRNHGTDEGKGLFRGAPRRRGGDEPKDVLVSDESDDAIERIRSAGELSRTPLNESHPRWGYGIGGDGDVDDVVAPHAAMIRAIARFGLHEGTGATASEASAKPDAMTRAPETKGDVPKKTEAPPHPRYLVAYDFSPMADGALQWAAELARSSGADLIVLNVIPLAIPPDSPGVAMVYPSDDDLRLRRKELRDVLASRRIDARIEIATAVSAGETVVSVARELEVDHIVLGTHGRTGLKRLFLGSVAEHVLRHANCPVTTIREHTAFASAAPPVAR